MESFSNENLLWSWREKGKLITGEQPCNLDRFFRSKVKALLVVLNDSTDATRQRLVDK